MSKYIFAVDDNGHSHHKLAYMVEGQIKTLKVPSIVGDGANPITDTNGIPQDTYKVNDRFFCCNSQIQSPIDLRHEGYQAGDENKALVAHTIIQADLPQAPIILGVTLPWRQAFLKDGKPNSRHTKEVAEHFASTDVINLTTNQPITIVKAKPYSEGLSAFFDWGIDEKGSLEAVDKLQGPVAVVDIGGSTTDIITVLGGSSLNLDHSRSDTKKVGVLDAKEQVASALSRALQAQSGINPDTDGGIPDWMLQEVFSSGKIKVGQGIEIDITEQVDKICGNVASQILSFIKTTLGNPLGYQALVIAGGGAIVFKKYLKTPYPHASFLDEFANARGALKFMLKIDRNNLTAGLQE